MRKKNTCLSWSGQYSQKQNREKATEGEMQACIRTKNIHNTSYTVSEE